MFAFASLRRARYFSSTSTMAYAIVCRARLSLFVAFSAPPRRTTMATRTMFKAHTSAQTALLSTNLQACGRHASEHSSTLVSPRQRSRPNATQRPLLAAIYERCLQRSIPEALECTICSTPNLSLGLGRRTLPQHRIHCESWSQRRLPSAATSQLRCASPWL